MAWTKRAGTKGGEPRYKVYWYDPSGAQHSKTFARSEDARRFARNIEVRKDEGTYTDPALGKISVAQLAERFMATAGPNLRPATVALYEMQLRRHIVPGLGHRRLSSVGKADVRSFEAELLAAGKGRATVSGVHRLLHRLFAFAIDEDRIGRNPADLPRDELPKAQAREARFLTEAEVATVAQEVSDRYRALVWTLAVGGLRIGEATALRVGALDLKAGTIRVTANAPEVNGHKLLDQPTKTARSTRTVDIPAALSVMLAEHLNQFGNRFDASSLVFTNERGHPVLQSNFRKNIFGPAAKRAGIDPAPRVHDLRHTAASFMARAGYTLLEAAEQLGHSATAMTEHYSHVFPDARQEKVSRLDGLLNRQPTLA
jgi:integrase